jgi:ribose transport system ATP-binding protein
MTRNEKKQDGEHEMDNLLLVRDLTKTYPGVLALDCVSFDVRPGEVHALIGENGAGKSTLIKALTGAIEPDSGQIEYDGKQYDKMTPAQSKQVGIAAIYQEFNLAPSVTVAENIFIGSRLNKGAFVDFKQLYAQAERVLSNFNVKISTRAKVDELTVAYRQLVEIAKAIAQEAKLIIMDEPTAPLTEDEVVNLFEIVQRLKKQGVSIIFISHRMDELFQISDRVTVMRDGAVISTYETAEVTKAQLIKDMVGRELTENYPGRSVQYGDVVLKVENLHGNIVHPISFELRRGEVLGLAGLVGAGRTELARLIFGADRKDGGSIYVDGKAVNINSPFDAVACGIGLVSEDRKLDGVLLRKSISDNITMPILKRLSNWLMLNKEKEKHYVNKYTDALHIKTPSIYQLVGNLSGGNQQKVALSKWLAAECKVLILDEPTRGIDVGAKQEIYQLINQLAEQGIGIIIISSEMEEILGMSDRLLILSEGQLMARLEREDFKQTTVLHYASGEKE